MSKTPEKLQQGRKVKLRGTPENASVLLADRSALTDLFGTENDDLANALLRHCIKVLKADEVSDEYPGLDERDFVVGIVEDLAPGDAVERMLAVQMAATHAAMVRVGGMFARAENLPQYEAHERAFNKLARTFTSQVEALRKHRNGGKQTVTVQHVNVEDGGKAIVGNVETGGRCANEK